MIFNEGYYTPMDRNYGVINTPGSDPEENAQVPLQIEPARKDFGIPTEELGIGIVAMQPGAEALKARIWGGANKVELAFGGMGKGSQQGLTPGSFSREEREAIRDLARVNKVQVQTHAAIGINGLSGFSQNEFNETQRKSTLDEVKRAIDFSAEATTGGAVVVHTGEFPRAMTKIVDKQGSFQAHLTEGEEAVSYLVDSHTGRLISAVRDDEFIWQPVQKVENGKAKFMMEPADESKYKHDTFVEEYNDAMSKVEPTFAKMDARIPIYETGKAGDIQTAPLKFKQFQEKLKDPSKREAWEKPFYDGIEERYQKELSNKANFDRVASVAFFWKQREAEVQRSLGSAREFEQMYIDGISQRHKYVAALNAYTKLWNEIPEKEKWRHHINEYPGLRSNEMQQFIPPDVKNPVEFLKEQLEELDRRIAYGRETSVGSRIQARQIQDQLRYVQDVETYANKKTSESIAEAAVYAVRRESQENKKRKDLGIDPLKPIFVSPENLFPEQWGSHPEETGTMIEQARKAFIEKVWDKDKNRAKVAGFSNYEDVKKKADETIKGTIDVGHLNIWRKYWKEDPMTSLEKNDENFQKWAVGKLKKLVDKGLIGNIHMHDNFGYNDEHLEIGRGTAPIEGFMKVLKEGGLGKDIIIEINSTNLNTALPHAMAQLGNPIYAAGAPLVTGAPNQFGQMRGAYAGQAQSPFYIVGAYSPSEDWRIWTETPLE